MLSKLLSGDGILSVPLSWIGLHNREENAEELIASIHSKIEVFCGNESSPDSKQKILETMNNVRAKGLSLCVPVVDEVVSSLQVHLVSPEPDVVLHTLDLLDSMIKSCGFVFHGMVGRQQFMKSVADVARKHSAEQSEASKKVATRALDCVQTWGEAFYPREDIYPHIYQTYTMLCYKYKLRFPRPPFASNRVPIVLGEVTETEKIVAKALVKNVSPDYQLLEQDINKAAHGKSSANARASTESVQSVGFNNFFENSTPTNTTKFDCAVCLERLTPFEGFACARNCGSFTCWDCLLQSYKMAAEPGAIQGGSSAEGELLCSDIKCRHPVKVLDLARGCAPEEVLQAQEGFRVHVNTTKKVAEALKQQESQIRGEYARIEQIKDADEKVAVKLRLKIVDEVLTLRCPRCKAAFLDFDGCFALRCGNNNCRCGFCAWCLKDCGHDAHGHLLTCWEGLAYLLGPYYAPFETFREHHKKKRTTNLQALIREAALSNNATEKLAKLMKRDLEDLGIQPRDVFAQQPAGAARRGVATFFGWKLPFL